MKEFWECVFSHNGLAYGTGAAIFLITLFLVSRRIIGFTLAVVFLIFALLASLAVAHQASVKNYIDTLGTDKKEVTYPGAGTTSAPTINDKIQDAFDDLKAEFDVQRKKLEEFIEEQTKQQNGNKK